MSYGLIRVIVFTHSYFGVENIFLFIPSTMAVLITRPSTCHNRASVRVRRWHEDGHTTCSALMVSTHTRRVWAGDWDKLKLISVFDLKKK